MIQPRKINRVLLINPSVFTLRTFPDINPMPHLGLGYLAAVLEERGIQVRVFDSYIEGVNNIEEISDDLIRIGAPSSRLESEIRDFAPDLVGVSNLFSRQAENAHAVYKIAKKVSPRIIVVAGGAHPTVMPQQVMEDKNVDFVVLGEGEVTLSELIDHLEGKKEISELDGIALRDNGCVKIIPKRRFIQDLDSIPLPARHLLHMEKYFGLPASHGKRHSAKFSPIITSRGCPIGCTFCTTHHVWGRVFRKRSPENIIREMVELKEKYQIEELMFEDDNVTLDVKRAGELFDLMTNERLGFKWDTPNGVSAFALDEKLIKKMQDSGCYKLNIAVESGNKDVLRDIIKKPVDLERVRSLVYYARSIGLDVGIFLIIGMPGETIKQMWDSCRYAKSLKIYDPFISVATPYPGSELYKVCIENGYISTDNLLDKLYIASCSISTREWSGRDVRKVFRRMYYDLQLNFYKRHPLMLMKRVLKKTHKIIKGRR